MATMRRILLSCLILFPFFITSKAQEKTLYVKVKRENIRAAPRGKILGQLYAGAKLEVLDENPKWVKVRFTGWIWKESVTEDSTDVVGFKMRALHILVRTREEAEEVLREIKAGTDFRQLARKRSLDPSASKGGDLGYFGKGELLKEFEDAVLKLKPGEVSDVVKTRLGYHIIKRIE